MKEKAIALFCGKPVDGSRSTKQECSVNAASFTRFVLPFAYNIQETKPSGKLELFYQSNLLENLSFLKRRKYFSRETSLTLYERSLWLDMSTGWKETPWGKEEVCVTLRDRQFILGMLPPRVVLFEAGSKTAGNRLETLSRQAPHVLHSGFLLVDIYFPLQEEKPELDDLLLLNEFFRFFGMPYEPHADRFKENFGEIPAEYSCGKNYTKVKDQGKLERYFERWANLLELPIEDDGKFYQLFPEEWAENARKLSYSDDQTDRDKNWQIYADNRCFVWTAAFLEKGGETLHELFEPDKKNIAAKDYGHWVKLLNVDPPVNNTHKSVTEFDKEWADERTYKRWEKNGTWYGFCYHSGAVLGEPQYTFAPYSSYYFDTTLLLFYIRITLFGFSRELTQLFHMEEHNTEKWRDRLRDIRELFAKFTILYQFPLRSNQQQQIEMFELNRKYFDIDRFFSEIQREIDNTHDFLETVESKTLSKAANKIATWGIPLAVGGLLSSIFGMDSFNLSKFGDATYSIDYDRILETSFVIIATFATFFLVRQYFGDKK